MSRMQVETVEVRRFKLGVFLGIVVTLFMFWAELHVTWNIGITSLGVHPFGAFANHQEYLVDGMLSMIRWPGSGEAWATYYKTMQESGLVDSFFVHLVYPFAAAALCGLITLYIVAKKRTVILREYPQRMLSHDKKANQVKGQDLFDSLMPEKPAMSVNPKMESVLAEKVKEGILLKSDPDLVMGKKPDDIPVAKKSSPKRVVDQIRQDKKNLREVNNHRRLRTSSSKFAKPTMEAPKVPRREYDYSYVPQGNPLQWPVNPAKVVPGENSKSAAPKAAAFLDVANDAAKTNLKEEITEVPKEVVNQPIKESLKETPIETISENPQVVVERPQEENSGNPVEEPVAVSDKTEKKSRVADAIKARLLRRKSVSVERESQAESVQNDVQENIGQEKVETSSNKESGQHHIDVKIESIPDNEAEKLNGKRKAKKVFDGPQRIVFRLPGREQKQVEVEISQTPEERRLMAEAKSQLAKFYGVEYDNHYRRKEAQYLTGEINEQEFNDWLAHCFYDFAGLRS